ncbi:2-hydroxyacid dehydrogenase [Aliibacillus thermotolerans]|uniref:2-hydroxyacid dehydrogenase n=1 Tax=Aliibacillus thermotolerans TaxID=1834418 RepID=A0ABW0U7Y9_9BACI|nr:D-glycerate dehydrogenase [Aliibacillus thermotolerans]MDA3130871.1 bifunctional glyoxylate/hydroxypyruvate reductase B [Aliibacillus thermotolerans]
MKPVVVAYSRVRKVAQDKLREKVDLRYYPYGTNFSNENFKKDLQIADGYIGLEKKVDEEFLSYAPHLKVASNVSVGYDNFDLEAMTKRGVMATNTPGVLDDTVADAIFGMMLAAARRISELDRYVKDGEWKTSLPDEKFGVDVHHRTLGIIGAGRIGEKIAKRAHLGFDMPILYHNRSRKKSLEEAYGATYCSLHDLLTKSDFVCLMTPSTPETRNLMGEKEFRIMKKSAIFVNGSRGATVDEDALVKALKEGEILGAALDVYKEEPIPPNHPLLTFPNVVTTPHLGSSTFVTEDNMSLLAAENVLAALAGKRPPNLLNEEVWEKK